MALQYVTPEGTLIVPGAVASWKAAPQNAGLSATGVLMLVGEAESGPSYAEEGNLLYQNSFGPDQKADVVAKYGSGPLVDAYNMAVAPSNDANLVGSPNRIVIAKTNTGGKATSALLDQAGDLYGNLNAMMAGQNGNMIVRSVTAATSEIVPTTPAFVLASPSATTTVNCRVNGGSVATASLSANDTPAAMVTAINALTGVACTGGASRGTLISSGDVVLTHDTGYACHITGTFLVTPTRGDIMFIPASGPFDTDNEGTYAVTAATSGRIDLFKVRDAGANTVTEPKTETVTITGATDVVAYSPVTIAVEAGSPVAGKGKSLEIAEGASGTFSDYCYIVASAAAIALGAAPAAKATFVSTTAAPKLLTSSAEYQASLNLVRASDATNQSITMGGDVILTLGYVGTSATAVISGTTMDITLVDGASSGLSPISINLVDFRTVADLCQYLNTLGGFTAAPALTSRGSVASVNLDDGTYTFATEKGVNTGRIKADGYYAALGITEGSTLVDIDPPGVATKLKGLPAVAANAFLTGGSSGATLQADVTGAFDALQNVNGNFLVPLFSNDAAADIADGTTNAASTYAIDGIITAARAHVLQMSTLKRSRPRQAVLSYDGTFTDDKNAAGNLASYRCALAPQGCKDIDANGNLKTYKPWAMAVKAAAMQAAGNYKDITGKFIAVSGLVDPSGYDNQSYTAREDALKAGLLVAIHEEDGGYTWVSDQNTYTVDSNFLYNSFQAVYKADVVAMTARKRMERAFKGQDLSDVSASTGVWTLGNILDDLKAAKFLAGDDESPAGYRNLIVKVINGNAMVCSGEVKVSTGIKFIPISFMVTPIQQSAQG